MDGETLILKLAPLSKLRSNQRRKVKFHSQNWQFIGEIGEVFRVPLSWRFSIFTKSYLFVIFNSNHRLCYRLHRNIHRMIVATSIRLLIRRATRTILKANIESFRMMEISLVGRSTSKQSGKGSTASETKRELRNSTNAREALRFTNSI